MRDSPKMHVNDGVVANVHKVPLTQVQRPQNDVYYFDKDITRVRYCIVCPYPIHNSFSRTSL